MSDPRTVPNSSIIHSVSPSKYISMLVLYMTPIPLEENYLVGINKNIIPRTL